MKINGKSPEAIHPELAKGIRKPDASKPGAADANAPQPPRAERSDSVSISDAGRAKAAELQGSRSPEHLAQIRQKVLQGAYNSLDVVDQVAKKILERGDL